MDRSSSSGRRRDNLDLANDTAEATAPAIGVGHLAAGIEPDIEGLADAIGQQCRARYGAFRQDPAAGTDPEGAVQVRFGFTTAEPVPGAGGTLRISAGGRVLAEGAIAGTALLPNGVSETFDVGFDSGGQVSDAYSGGGRFSGVIRKVEVIAPAPAR